jgi:hypothetical protein
MTDDSATLARRVARDLGIDDWLWVEEAVRRRHRVMFMRYDQVSSDEYDALRDGVEADLFGSRR